MGATYQSSIRELPPRAKEGFWEPNLFHVEHVYPPKNLRRHRHRASHAGIEAASAAARLSVDVDADAETLILWVKCPATQRSAGRRRGKMREIDALGGVMGLNTDATSIQFRMLNAKKARAHDHQAQCDKKAYQSRQSGLNARQISSTSSRVMPSVS